MYLSRLKLDSLIPAARRDLASAYDMHRTLSRVFAENDDSPPSSFLWRLESTDVTQGVTTLLIQSNVEGRWHKLPGNGYLLDVASKALDLNSLLQLNRHYRFRLLANPTVTRSGKRYGLTGEDDQLAWLHRQLQKAGCRVLDVMRTRSERWTVRKKGHVITVQAAGFDGVLTLEQAELLRVALLQGVGHAKSLGLGMLSVAAV